MYQMSKALVPVFSNRLDYGPGYRLYFGRDGDELVILLIARQRSDKRKTLRRHRPFWRDSRPERLLDGADTRIKDSIKRGQHRSRIPGCAFVGCRGNLLDGDLEAGKSYCATSSMLLLALKRSQLGVPAKSLMRCSGKGQSAGDNCSASFAHCRTIGIQLAVAAANGTVGGGRIRCILTPWLEALHEQAVSNHSG